MALKIPKSPIKGQFQGIQSEKVEKPNWLLEDFQYLLYGLLTKWDFNIWKAANEISAEKLWELFIFYEFWLLTVDSV